MMLNAVDIIFKRYKAVATPTPNSINGHGTESQLLAK